MAETRKFAQLLQTQIRHEFTAAQQYIALAVWFDARDLPRLAKRFYRQAIEARNHALAMVRYLLDRDQPVAIPGTGDVRNDFSSAHEAIELAVAQERAVTADIEAMAKAARAEEDYLGEQFVHWFLKEQVEEVAQMSTLLTVVERAGGNLFEVESHLFRESATAVDEAPDMPPVAGGKL
ncbi:ferritin [Amycolatopsis balhimycina DSM 5908]|uniref:Ferritin n=1 Tax=Amycolatopsis balhimycina DSM 5908 TaxID=1081091 RepID=A0A428WKU5_AMYBA|nr:ferritin [Amycolatopsis balhimycina]RSM43652.1 ferritin [Amycolatopsis balhimycina DSM 5908]